MKGILKPRMMSSIRDARSMKLIKMTILIVLPASGRNLLIYPMYMMLRQASMMIPTELEKTMLMESNVSLVLNELSSNTNAMTSLMKNMPPAARRTHLMYDGGIGWLPSEEEFLLKMLLIAMILHPRTSVVTVVDNPWMTIGDEIRKLSMLAPRFPMRYPMMLPMITVAAVNSTLSFFL